MKSVLHLRIEAPGFSSEPIAKAFRDAGYRYSSLDWQKYRFEHGIDLLREKVISLAKGVGPEIIFCHIQNSEVLPTNVWMELADIGFVVNYTFDVRRKDQTMWMYKLAPKIGFTFFACKDDAALCRSYGTHNVSHVHSSCDMDLYKSTNHENKFAFDVMFCGNNYLDSNLEFPLAKERQAMVDFLATEYKTNFGVYGLGQKGGLVRPEVEASIYNHSRIAICQNNFHKTDYSSDRIWRIMASGAFCLCRYFPGMEKTFKKEIHLDWFENLEEMKMLIDYYLKHEEERKEVAAAGCKFVRENHTWGNRIGEMENIFGEYRNSLLLTR